MKIFRFFITFIIIIAVSVGIFVLVVTIFGKGTTVIVPQLVGKRVSDFQNSSFPIIVNIKEYNTKFPKGVIISQDPVAKSTMKKGHPIVVNVSLGPKVETLPDFSNDLLQQTKLKITSLNFKIGRLTYIYSPKPVGTVIAQSPQPGTIYKENEPISLLISKGKKKPRIIIKNLIGSDYQNVVKTFKSLNYDVKIKKEYSLRYPVNTIIDQNPKNGSVIKNSLELTVNSISRYEDFIYVDYPATGTLKIEKSIGNSVVYSNKLNYKPPYMDYFFDYRPFSIKIYIDGILVKKENASIIK